MVNAHGSELQIRVPYLRFGLSVFFAMLLWDGYETERGMIEACGDWRNGHFSLSGLVGG